MYSDFIESPTKDCFSFNDQSFSYDMAEINEINNHTNFDIIFDSYYSSLSRYNTDFELPEDCKNMSFSELFDQELLSTHENKDCQITIKIEKEESLNPCYSADNLQDTPEKHSLVKVEENISLSTLPNNFTPKKGINRTFIKSTENNDVKHFIHNPFEETGDLNINDASELLYLKCMPEDNTESTVKTIVDSEVKPCYTIDCLQDTTMVCSLVKSKDDVTSSLLKSTTQEYQKINRTPIKTAKSYDIKHAYNNCIDQMPVNNKMPIIKSEPVDVNDTINEKMIEVKPFSTDNLSNTIIDNHKLKKTSILPSLPNKSISKQQGIYKASKETIKYNDVKHVSYNNYKKYVKNIDQMSVNNKISAIKSKPEVANDTINRTTIEMRVKPISTDISSNTLIGNHSFKSKKGNGLSSLSNKSISKHQNIHKSSKETIKSFDVKHVAYNNCKNEVVGIDQLSINYKIPIIKSEPVDVNDTSNQNIIEMRIKPFSIENSSNTMIDNYSFKPKNDNILSSLPNKLISKQQGIYKASKETIKNYDVKHVALNNCKKEVAGIDQISVNDKTIFVKSKPVNVCETINQNINMKVKSYCLTDKLSKTTIDNHSFVKVKDNVLSSLPQNFLINRRGTHKISLKNAKSCNAQHSMNNNFCKTNVGIDQISANVKTTIVKHEPEEINDPVEQKIVEMKIKDSEKNQNHIYKEEIKHFNDLNNINIENVKVINIKKENIVPNVTSLKKDIISQTCTIKNETNLETEKKKISWEEFRAKRGKMGLLNNLENKEEPAVNIVATENDKLEAIIKEFDRNTAEHFVGQKRKIEEPNSIIQEICNEEDQELQKKRMKIEYIKKLLPSSFASEIAKTSSLMKGILVEDIENENTSDDSVISNDKNHGKYSDIYDGLGYPIKDDKYKKKNYQIRAYSSRYNNSSRSDNCNKSRSSSTSSNSDDYYNRGKIDTSQHGGQYGQNTRNPVTRTKDQKKVVYVGQIPIRFGKRYLYNRFKVFGKIQSITLHRKPDFRVYYAFVTYSEKLEADRAISRGNDDKTQIPLDIRFGERKQTQTPYYDLDDEWLTDWYAYTSQPIQVVRTQSPEKVSFEEELQEFHKLAQIKKLNEIKPSQVS